MGRFRFKIGPQISVVRPNGKTWRILYIVKLQLKSDWMQGELGAVYYCAKSNTIFWIKRLHKWEGEKSEVTLTGDMSCVSWSSLLRSVTFVVQRLIRWGAVTDVRADWPYTCVSSGSNYLELIFESSFGLALFLDLLLQIRGLGPYLFTLGRVHVLLFLGRSPTSTSTCKCGDYLLFLWSSPNYLQ